MRIFLTNTLIIAFVLTAFTSCITNNSPEGNEGNQTEQQVKPEEKTPEMDEKEAASPNTDATDEYYSEKEGVDKASETLAEIIASDPNMSIFARYAKEPLNFKILNLKKDLVVFVPTDDLIELMGEAEQLVLKEKGVDNNPFLQKVFQEYVFTSKENVLSKLNSNPQFYIKNFNGTKYSIQKSGLQVSINESNVIGKPIYGKNGMILIIDQLIDRSILPSES